MLWAINSVTYLRVCTSCWSSSSKALPGCAPTGTALPSAPTRRAVSRQCRPEHRFEDEDENAEDEDDSHMSVIVIAGNCTKAKASGPSLLSKWAEILTGATPSHYA